jgi:hypothetical protein
MGLSSFGTDLSVEALLLQLSSGQVHSLVRLRSSRNDSWLNTIGTIWKFFTDNKNYQLLIKKKSLLTGGKSKDKHEIGKVLNGGFE